MPTHVAQPRQRSAPMNEAAARASPMATSRRRSGFARRCWRARRTTATAWALLTETALQRGRPDAAIVCADRAVALHARRIRSPHILRAKCLFVSGEAGARASRPPKPRRELSATHREALDALGAIFGLLGLHERAKQFFLRAVAARPDVPQYLFNLAATERMTGTLEAAEAHCDAAIALDRHYGLAHYLRSDLRIQTADRNHVAEMEALIRERQAGAARRGHAALRARPRNARIWTARARLRSRRCRLRLAAPLDRLRHAKAEIAEIDRIIRTHTRGWLGSRAGGLFDRRSGVRRRPAAHRHHAGRADHRQPRRDESRSEKPAHSRSSFAAR